MSKDKNKEEFEDLLDMILFSMLAGKFQEEMTGEKFEDSLEDWDDVFPGYSEDYAYDKDGDDEDGDLIDTLYMSSDDIEKAFNKKEDYPTHEEIEDVFNKISEESFFSKLAEGGMKGIRHHEQEKSNNEMVNHPDHYNKTEIETMEKFILINHDRPDKIKGALEFNIIKYSDRVGEKDPTPEGIKQDNAKINFYLEVYELLFPEALEDINRYKVWKDSK